MLRVFKLVSVAAPVMSLWWYAHSLSSQQHHKQHASDHHDQQHQHQHRDQDRHHHPQHQEQQQQQQQNHQHNHEHSNGVDGHSHEPVEKRSRWMKTASQALMGWQSFNSDNSAQTSASSASLEMLLNERQSDPEQMLLSLGFGGESPSYVPSLARVPMRFLQQPSMAHGISIPGVGEEEDDDNYDDDAEEEEEDDNRGTPREETYGVERRHSGGRRTPGRTGRRKPGGFCLDGVCYWSRCGYLGVWALLQRGVPLYFFNEDGSHCYNMCRPKSSGLGGTGENRRRRKGRRRVWSQSRQEEGGVRDVRGEGQEWQEDGGRLFDVGDGGMGWSRENGEEWSGMCYGEAGSQSPSAGAREGEPICATVHNDIICPPGATITLSPREGRNTDKYENMEALPLPYSEHAHDFNGNGSPEILPPSFHTLPSGGFVTSSPMSSSSTHFAQTSIDTISEPDPNIRQASASHYSDAMTNSPQIQSCIAANTSQQGSLGKSGKEGDDVDFFIVTQASRSEVQPEDDSRIEDVGVIPLALKEDEMKTVNEEISDLSARRHTPVTTGSGQSDQSGQTERADRSSVERKGHRKQDYDLKLLTSAMQEHVSRVKNVAKNFMSRFHAADDTSPQRTGQKGQESGVSSSTNQRGQSVNPGQKGQESSSNSGPGRTGQRSSINVSPGQKDQKLNPSAGSGQRNQGAPQHDGLGQRDQGLRPNKGKSGGKVVDRVSREKGKSFEKHPTTKGISQNTTRAQEAAEARDAASSSSDKNAQRLRTGRETTDGLDRGDNSCAVTCVYNEASFPSVRGGDVSPGDGKADQVRATGVEIPVRDRSVERGEERSRGALPCSSGPEDAGPVDKNEPWTENDDLEWCYDGESLDLNQVTVKPVSSHSSASVGSIASLGSVASVCRTSEPITVQTRVPGTTLVSSRPGLGPNGADLSGRPGRTCDQISEPKQVQQSVKTVRVHVPGSGTPVLSAGGARKPVNVAGSHREAVTVTVAATSAPCTFSRGGGQMVGKVGHVISFTVPGPRSQAPLTGVSTGVMKQVSLGEGGGWSDGRDDGKGGQETERDGTGAGGGGAGEAGGGGGTWVGVHPPTDPNQAASSSLRKEARSFLSSVLASKQAAELSGSRSATSSQPPYPHPHRPPSHALSSHKPAPHTPTTHTPSSHTQQPLVHPTQPLIVQLTSPFKRYSLDSPVIHSPLQGDPYAKGQGQGREQHLQGEGRDPEHSRKCRWSQSVRIPNHPRIPAGAAVVRRRISTGSVGGGPPSSASSPAISCSSSSASFFTVRMTSRSADEFTRLTAKDFEEPDLTNVSSSSEEEEETEGEEEERKRRSSVRFTLAKGESLV